MNVRVKLRALIPLMIIASLIVVYSYSLNPALKFNCEQWKNLTESESQVMNALRHD